MEYVNKKNIYQFDFNKIIQEKNPYIRRLHLVHLSPGVGYSAQESSSTVYRLLKFRVPTVNQILQNECLQFIGFAGHYFTPVLKTSVTGNH